MSTTPADIVGLLYDDLVAWAATRKGEIALAHNPWDLLDSLGNRPGSWRLTIYWPGDKPADESVRDCNVVENEFRFVLDGDLGPTKVPRIALIKDTPARGAFLALLDAVRFRLRCYRFSGLNTPNDKLWYRGTDDNIPLPGGVIVAVYNLRFILRSMIAVPAEGDVVQLGE